MKLYLAGSVFCDKELFKNTPKDKSLNRLVSFMYKSDIKKILNLKEDQNEQKGASKHPRKRKVRNRK